MFNKDVKVPLKEAELVGTSSFNMIIDDNERGGRQWHEDNDNVNDKRQGGQQCGVLGDVAQTHRCQPHQQKIRSGGGGGRRRRLR